MKRCFMLWPCLWRPNLGLSISSSCNDQSDDRNSTELILAPLLAWLDRVSGDSALVYYKDRSKAPGRFFRDSANRGLELRRPLRGGERGVFVRQSDKESNVLVAIPPQSLMTPSSARDTTRSEPLASALLRHDAQSDPSSARTKPPLSDLAMLVAHLACERSKVAA